MTVESVAIERPTPGSRGDRAVRTAPAMGTMVSVHVIGGSAGVTDAAASQVFEQLERVEQVFSTFRETSDISRIARGSLTLREADPLVREVFEACEAARDRTAGLFDAWHRGWFDPTGYVKGWAVERAARQVLQPLLEQPSVRAVGIGAGGDMQLSSRPGEYLWTVGVADPARPGAVVATLQIEDGAVATSGTAERGGHIVDPRTGRAATSVASATVVASHLTDADLWATTAVVAGFEHLDWIAGAGTRSGLLVASDGSVRRWVGAFEVVDVEHAAERRKRSSPDKPILRREGDKRSVS